MIETSETMCDCPWCHDARLLAAWAVLSEEGDLTVRISARILLTRMERMARSGEDQPLMNIEAQALQVCHDWIVGKPTGLRYLDRVVGVSGTPWEVRNG